MKDELRQVLVQQAQDVEIAPLQHETLVFHPQSNRFCMLNRTSSFIWNRMKTPASPEQIATELCANFSGVSLAQAQQDVEAALSTLMSLDLVITHNLR